MGTVTTKPDSERVARLVDRARREVDDGLLPAVQIAVGLDGEIVLDETFGADPSSRFVPFSCTKAIVAGAVVAPDRRRLLDVSEPVASYLPEFATNGKEGVTVEHVLAPHGRVPVRAARTRPLGHRGGPAVRVRQVAPQLRARPDVHVPPDRRALGAGVADRDARR